MAKRSEKRSNSNNRCHGMDVKTLSTIIGHISSAITLNVYAHVADDMQGRPQPKLIGASASRKQQNPHRWQNPTPQ